MATITNEKWQTKQPSNPYNSVGDTAYQMHQRRFFGTKCWLGYTPFEFNNDTINECLREGKPSNCAVLLRSSSFATEDGLQEEKWVGTKFKVVENKELYVPKESFFLYYYQIGFINQTLINNGYNSKKLIQSKPWPSEFRLPEENKYVVKNLPLKSDSSQSWTSPKRIQKSADSELWFKTDSKFKIPRAYICVNFLNKLASKSLKNQVMMDMLLFGIRDLYQSSRDFILASEAGIDCQILGTIFDVTKNNDHDSSIVKKPHVTNDTRPVGILLTGYDSKLPEIILQAVNMLLNFKIENKDGLEELVNQLQRAYQSTMISDPIRVCNELGTRLLINNYYSLPERLEFIQEVVLSNPSPDEFMEEFHHFQQKYIRKSFYQVHIEGNMTEKEATSVFRQIKDLTKAKGPGSFRVKSAISPPKIRHHQTPIACKVAGMNPNSEMTFCSLAWVLGKLQSSRKLSALSTFVQSMMHQPTFDWLRTKNALGYIAATREWSRSGIKAIAIECNTNINRVTVEEVEALMTKCTTLILKQFEDLTEEQYKSSKEAYVKLLAKPAESMDSYFGSNQVEIFDGTQRFRRKEEESAELLKVTKEEFVQFYKEYIIKNERRIFVAVEGCSKHTQANGLFKHLPLENTIKYYEQISDFGAMPSSFY